MINTKRSIFFLAFVFALNLTYGQIIEDFEDEMINTTPNDFVPSWSGDSEQFVIVDEGGDLQLRSNAGDLDASLTYFISTPCSLLTESTWEFYVNLDFSTSGSNYADIFLASDAEDLSQAQNGYFIRVGDTEDWIALHKIVSGNSTENSQPLISTGEKILGSSNNIYKIRVNRDDIGNWELLIDEDELGAFTSIGTILDAEVNTSSFFGILIQQSSASSPANSHYFDDISVTSTAGPDTTPPTIQNVMAISETEVDVDFSENVDETTSQVIENYSINNGIIVTSAVRDGPDNSLVHLTVNAMTNGESYTLTVNNVEDENGNVILADSKQNFDYLVFDDAEEFDVMINEFMPDPNPVITNLPDAEYVELFNRSNKFFDLQNWTLDDQTLPSFTMRPDSYVLVVEDDDEVLFSDFSNVLTITTLSLSNSDDDSIVLLDDEANRIHSIGFIGSTGGISTELINPNGPDYSENNYGLSVDSDGGTPGGQNSIFDDTPDTTPPTIIDLDVLTDTEIDIRFSEVINKSSAEIPSNYSIDGGIMIESATLDETDHSLVHLEVSMLVSAQVRTLTVNGVEDLSGNVAINEQVQFEFIETEFAKVGDVVINEFYAIPDAESGIPNAEFVELYNRSLKYLELEDWTINDGSSSSSTFPVLILRPGEYLILSKSEETVSFEIFGKVVGLSTFPTLNNSGDAIVIRDASQDTIHQITYSSASSGTSIELINPNGPDYSENNYGLSINPDGGTPGEQNSIFDDTPDTAPPKIQLIEVISSSEMDVFFSEVVDVSSAETLSNYVIDGGILVESATIDEIDQSLVHLVVSTLVPAEVRTLTVSGVEDLSGNSTNDQAQFEYIETTEAEAGDVIINEFLATPTAESLLPNAEFIELYNNSSKFIELENWIVNDGTGSSSPFASFILRPDSFLIITTAGNGSLYETYGDVLEVNNLPSLNNGGDEISIESGTSLIVAEITYTSSQPGISTELINPNDPCLSFTSYSNSIDPRGGTPGNKNSVFDATPDTTIPTVISSGFNTVLTINFSEVMDQVSLSTGNYAIGNLTVDEILVEGEFPTFVQVSFEEPITSGEKYELTISDVTDCSGNELAQTSVSFGFGRAPTFNEILITEIHFDEDPSIGLPEREFLEIYNASNDVLTTEGMQLTDATSTVDLPIFNLDAGEYYVLTSNAGASEFPTNSIGVSGFPSLNNSGEQLILSLEDKLVFSIAYDPDWHEEDKRDGGYSLEMLDILNPCVEDNNWASSSDPSGGTPGSTNSQTVSIPDSFGPSVSSVTAISKDTIRILFDEKIDPNSSTTGNISFSPSLDVSHLYFELLRPDALFVILDESIPESSPYTFDIQKVFDCNSNEVQETDLVFALPSIAEEGQIKLSEVLFNPRANGVDFVEIYNDSEKYLSLKNWSLARITDEGISDEKIVSHEELVIDPREYLVFTEDSDVLLNNYPNGMISQFFEMSSLPTYSNDTGNVILLNDLELIQEQFFYDEDYHYDLLEDDDGVSLERVSFTAETNDANNWRSASSTEGFATPGYENSQSFSQETPSGKVSINPKVFIPGNSGTGRDFTTINYQFASPGQFTNVNIYDQTGRLVRTLVQGELLATSGFLRWDGVTNNGAMARLGYYLVIFEVYDSSGNTETLKETVVVGRDF